MKRLVDARLVLNLLALKGWTSWLGRGLLLASLLLGPGRARAEISDWIKISGWVGGVASGSTRDGSVPTLDAHPWYFDLEAEPVEGYRLLAELEFEHVFRWGDGEGQGELEIDRLYLERNFSRAVNLRFGKFFLPLGSWYRTHWGFLTETVSRPISFDNAYAPRSQVGLQYWGSLLAGAIDLDYYAWITGGPVEYGTNARDLVEPGFGASVFARTALDSAPDIQFALSAGFHGQWVPVENQAGEIVAAAQRNEQIGFEAKLRYVDVRVEAFFHQLEDQDDDLFTWYGNVTGWILPELGVNYRFDRGADLKRTTGTSGSRYQNAHSLGLIWRPNNWALLKGEARVHDFAAEDLQDFVSFNLMAALRY